MKKLSKLNLISRKTYHDAGVQVDPNEAVFDLKIEQE